MNELQIQREVVRDLIAAGGFGFKSNNRFLIGVADLYLLHHGFPQPLWLEVKFERHMPKNGAVRLDLTPLQRRFICNVNRHGGVAGWLLVVSSGRNEYACAVGRNPIYERVASWPLPLHKKRGQPWPILAIMDLIHHIHSI